MNVGDRDDIVLRPAVASDVDAITDLERASFAHPGERFDRGRVGRIISDGKFTVFAAQRKEHLLGWAAGFLWLRGRVPWGRVYAIAVDPNARGKAIGRKLMERLLNALESGGADRIFLEVRVDNHAAVRLYEKLRFVPCCTLSDYYGRGIAGVRMMRVIASSPAASP